MLMLPAPRPSRACVALWIALLFASDCEAVLFRDVQQQRAQRQHVWEGNSEASKGGDAPFAIKLQNHIGVQYIGPVSFGGQEFGAIYDTGSFEAIVLSTRCRSCSDEIKQYNREMSDSFKPLDNESHVHVFGSGPVVARRSLETLRLGSTSEQWEVADMPFWEVEDHNLTVWSDEDGAEFSAIVGLGPGSDVPGSSAASLLDRLHVTDFSYCLEQGAGAGWLSLMPAMQETGYNFSSIPLISRNYWAVRLTNVTFSPSSPNRAACQSGCVAIVDTGTSLIGLPHEAYDKIMEGVPRVEEDCSNLADLPSLHFRLGDVELMVPPKIWVHRLSRRTIVETMGEDLGTPVCWPAFTRVEKETQLGQLWILGLPFFRYFYTVFDRGLGSPSLHVAVADGHCQGAATTLASASEQSQLPPVIDVSHARLPSWAQDGSPASLIV
mmetsp:Transcript_45389/g.105306  ORF Transcript_45389/g.105306 Transcript_45389/m.105306 type:complete len:438 (+) Transcript_45389:118-1431(+)